MSGINGNVVGTYVGKGANRSSHSARTAKAAQRTPLPPKAGTAAAERWASKPTSASQVIEDMLAEARAIVAAHKAAEAAAAVADEAPEEPSEAPVTAEPVIEATPAPEAVVEPLQPTPDAPKVGAYVDAARNAGWATSYTFEADQQRHVVTSERGAESIVVTFVDGHWSPTIAQIFRRADGSVVKLRNASAAKKQMSLTGSARPVPTALKTTRALPLTDAEDRPQRDLPVGFLDLDDDDLVAVLASGVKVVWRTPSTRVRSEAIIVAGCKITVEPNMLTGTKERRAVHFVEGSTRRSISLRSMLQIIPVA